MDTQDINQNVEVKVEAGKSQGHKKTIAVWFVLIAVLFYAIGFQSGRKGVVFQPKEFKLINKQDQPENVDYSLLWDVIKILDTKYIDKPINPKTMLYGAMRGAIQSAGDPYTDFFEPKALESFKSDLKGSFDGIGAEIGKRNGLITVIAPIADSPAEKAGIKAQDVIVSVNGKNTAEWSVEETVNQIRGQKGTEVTLMIYRESKGQPFEVKIIRDKIEVKSVRLEYKEIEGKQVAVIHITKFGDDTGPLFAKAVNDILTKNVAGVIVDVRNNPGGYLQTAVELGSYWIKKGETIVTEAHSDGTSQKFNSAGINKLANLKTVVLINGGSASASEILSGALHDFKIAQLIGEKSFGKGSVQELIDLKDGSAVKVTVAKWITPSGKNLNKDGLNPDIEVKFTDEDIAAGKDVQMDAALNAIIK